MTIGILGGGQLGKMLAEAAYSLGHNCIVYDPKIDCSASQTCEHHCYKFDNYEKLEEFAKSVDIITYEFEHLPIQTLEFVEQFNIVRPSIKALSTTQDRLEEKKLFKDLNIPTVKYIEISTYENLSSAHSELNYPFILKSRFGGYDGKGQIEVKSHSDLKKAWAHFEDKRLIAEQKISFDREVSMVSSRDQEGNIIYYDLCENEHDEGILSYTINKPLDKVSLKATACNKIILDQLDYVGTFTVEFFCVGQNLIANEYAPRVHNSGHWTIEGAAVSQFENHIRAICNMPLGSAKSLGHSVMVNLIGEVPDIISIAPDKSTFFHSYGKEAQKGRKVGHITIKSHIKFDPKSCHESIINY